MRSELAKENEATAVVLGLEYQEFPVRHADEIAAAITDAVFAGCDSLLIEATDILLSHRNLIASLAAQQRLPTISRHRGFVLAGGLASSLQVTSGSFRLGVGAPGRGRAVIGGLAGAAAWPLAARATAGRAADHRLPRLACAGMNRQGTYLVRERSCVPRMRGDEPYFA